MRKIATFPFIKQTGNDSVKQISDEDFFLHNVLRTKK